MKSTLHVHIRANTIVLERRFMSLLKAGTRYFVRELITDLGIYGELDCSVLTGRRPACNEKGY